MNTTPVFKGPTYARVYIADSLGRFDPQVFDQFARRKAAAAYWWMLKRKGIVAFLPDENRAPRSNQDVTMPEPAELRAAIDQCEREYDEEGGDEGHEWARMFDAWACSRGRA